MGNFFSELVSNDLITDWAETLDWLFDDNRFPKEKGWNGGHVSNFTKKVKKVIQDFNHPSKNGKNDSFVFPNERPNYSKPTYPTVYIAEKSSEGKNLIRHIRNGIAHGNTSISKVNETLYIEILDYKTNENKRVCQTAYIFIPISLITQMHKIYESIEKNIPTTQSNKTNNKNTKGRQNQK